ncbi:hypothetical protein C8Q75DRAFT_809168 [Abortiporus biennis]|nr:hypothetical protein C8Q75DRAFT_809168 [Abortiporus biennis]
MPSDVIRRNILDSFPGELFLYIKEQIPDCDLRTHVCFYNASPYFAASYGNNENKERLFEKAYIMSGLGILPHEDPKSISWVDLATRIILEDGFCDHPECGGSRLEQNVELMSRPDLMPTEPYWSNLKIYRKLFSYVEDNLKVNPLLSNVTFSKDRPREDGGVENDARLRYLSSHECSQRPPPSRHIQLLQEASQHALLLIQF